MFPKFVILVACFLAVYAQKDNMCSLPADVIPKLTEALKTCQETTKYQMPELKGEADTSKFLQAVEEKGEFDDKCFAKCLADKFKLIKDNKLDRTEFKKLIKLSNAPDDINALMEKIWMGCADSVESKAAKDTPMDDKKICKYSAMFKHCGVKELMANKDKLAKCGGKM